MNNKTTTKSSSSNNTTTAISSLERRLFQSLRDEQNCSTKEFQEAWAFCNKVRGLCGNQSFDVVIDVAGGHGALAALFLILTKSVKTAVAIDPAQVGSVQQAWGSCFTTEKRLQFRHKDLRTGLPSELENWLSVKVVPSHRILVVACHACQHSSEETLTIAQSHGVASAVMPCCQVDPTHSWKRLSKTLEMDVGLVMDLLLAGRCVPSLSSSQSQQQATTRKASQTSTNYTIRMKLLDSKITPQNRIILCRPNDNEEEEESNEEKKHGSQTHLSKSACATTC